MQPSGAVEQVRPVIGLYFSDRRPRARPPSCALVRRASTSRRAKAATSSAMPTPCRWTPTSWPSSRMRTTARRRSSGTATFPDGTSRRVMHIRTGTSAGSTSTGWSSRWRCRRARVCRWSTPTTTRPANVRNPEVPPIRVLWGQRSKDEMGDLWFQLLREERARPRSPERRDRRQDGRRGHHRLRDDAHGGSGRPRTARRRGAALPGDGEDGRRGAALQGDRRRAPRLRARALQPGHGAGRGGEARRGRHRVRAGHRHQSRTTRWHWRTWGASCCSRAARATRVGGSSRP